MNVSSGTGSPAARVVPDNFHRAVKQLCVVCVLSVGVWLILEHGVVVFRLSSAASRLVVQSSECFEYLLLNTNVGL